MSFRQRINPLLSASVLLLLVSAPALGQLMGTSSCSESMVETHLHFYYGPALTRVIAIDYRNISDRTCVLMRLPLPEDNGYNPPDTNLKPGDMVHRSFRWITEAPGQDCPGQNSIPFWSPPLPNPLQIISSGALAFDICSGPILSGFEAGPFKPDWPPSGPAPPPLPSSPILTSVQTTYYDRETIELHVKLPDRSPSNTICPLLLEEVRDARGNVRLNQRTSPPKGCHNPQDSWRGPWTGPANEYPIQTGGNINWGVEPLGERTITIIQVADDLAPDGELRLVRSNPITLNIIKTPHTCTTSDLEPDLHFYRAPDQMYVAALNYRNTSEQACIFPIHFVNRQQIEHPLVRIDPHQTINSSARWRTGNGASCEQLTQLPFVAMGLNRPVGLIVAPALLPSACSPLEQTDYTAGAFKPDWPADANATVEPLSPAPILFAPKQVYDAGEQIEWKITLPDRTDIQTPCPVILLTVRSFSSQVDARSDQINCTSPRPYWMGKWTGPPNQIPIQIYPNGGQGLPGDDTRTVTVYRVAAPDPDGEIRMIPSNSLTLRVVDPATIPRTWGKTNAGIRADLTLDKQTYTPDEDVPLHLAFENVSAIGPVYPNPPNAIGCDDSGQPVRITYKAEVRDDRGRLVPRHAPSEVFAENVICVRGSLQHVAMRTGKIIPLETSLRRLGLMPEKPGSYKVSVIWSAYRGNGEPGTDKSPAAPTSISKTPFATVTSFPLTVQITPINPR